MTRFLFFLLILLGPFGLTGCVDALEVKIPEGRPLLAVEGEITDQPGPYLVRLTKTAPYFEEDALPRVRGAVLTLADNEGHQETLREIGPGTYATSTLRGKVGNQYVLTIRSEGEEYRAETEIRRTPEIDSIRAEFRAKTATQNEGYYILYYGEETPGVGDYYRFKVFHNGILLNQPNDLIVTNDEFVDGNYINGVELTSEKGANDKPFAKGDRVRVVAESLPRDYFYFLNEMVTQLNNVGLFAAPPANVRTNVRNVQPGSDKAAVGYFAGHTVRADSLVIR
ncbi:protein of unknown function [Hymenobacter daecheongensis DSM 21074]|uniref:DUF4249 domain-containing protein n=1 Tax=Hymenobacter daecheongensis DSM 21074 TaxID=1121955 RepID=A0A1M6A0F9_9BACT|nr:DUF4249 domain-containing protein [Hymenobacter daecheongensis]SHI29918.1 protein of unknown function [Hymenobacter daecheongensis DSM 21074]